ncbi:N-acetyl-alpha-D-glucosaminyl L-malate synthase BshA [Deinococcus roseus]|uniref:N-acetyl-alpha-D-glucosaminyl L-malate synthase BshA n=1 Tax=Deinococcus roseus TaxID=392414 RepID=A0ABQ2D3L1_9DEIO|nr:N-acetyl-alpha-D-glucosaminyl L-malate synthase BshA [Deinococcus roseus]GGJ44717.1 N-acetyl-alpha-D-glucosaminyl L-malate synthase BshA [Deinococcus roseus]
MHVAILCHSTLGGSGVVASELALSLAQRDITVHVLSDQKPFRLEIPEELQDRLLFHPIETVNHPVLPGNLFSLSTITQLLQLTYQYPIDLVNVHYAIPFAPSAVFAREIAEGRFKVVTTLHGTDVTLLGQHPALKATLRYSLEQSDALTAVSDSLAQEARRIFDLSRYRPIHVIPNWVNGERFTFQDDPQNDFPLLMHASNFREVKRTRDVIWILHEVLKHRTVNLRMVGDGPDREACQQLAFELGIHPHIEWFAPTVHIERHLQQADVLLLPSENESFGLIALEAMACGVPVVASHTGGLPEVVVHGSSGLLRPVGDVEGMAASVLNILSDHNTHLGMRRAACKRSQRFQEDLIVPEYLRVFQGLVSRTLNQQSGIPALWQDIPAYPQPHLEDA